MRKKLFILAIVLITAIVAMPLAAKGAQESAKPAAAAAAGSLAKKLDITWLTPADCTAYKEGNLVEQVLEPKFNVDLHVIPINSMDLDKLKVTFAGGTIPDVLIYWNMEQWYKDGVIRSFSPDTFKTYMPATWKAIDEKGGNYAWQLAVSNVDGKSIAIPDIWLHGAARLVLAARQDWLVNVGIAKLPTNLDELYAVAKAFTFNDPDKNGKADTYGLGGAGLHPNPMFWQFQTILGAYGVHPQKWGVEDGQVVHGAVTKGYKEFLKLMQKWYKDGIVDPEFLTDQNATYASKISSGRLGLYDGHPNYFDLAVKTYPASILNQKDPNAKFVLLEPPKGPAGKSGAISYGGGATGYVASWAMMFGAKTSDEKMIRAMQIGEAINTDNDLFRLINFGTKEKTFDFNGEQSVVKQGIVGAAEGLNMYRTTMVDTWEKVRMLLSAPAIALFLPTVNQPIIADVVNPGKVNAAAGAAANQVEMDKLALEFYFNAIAGKINVDAEWDAYVKKFNDLGNTVKTDAARKLPRYY